MTVTIPLVFIAGVIVWLAYRYMGLRVWDCNFNGVTPETEGDTSD